MKLILFIGGHGSPQAGKPVYVNPEAVGLVTEAPHSKEGRRVTQIYIGSFPMGVAGSLEETLAKLGPLQQ